MSTQVEELTAGRELDAAVAERVMGWRREWATGRMYWLDPSGGSWREVQPYSRSIGAAWQVVEHLRKHRLDYSLRSIPGGHEVYFEEPAGAGIIVRGEGATAALAICRAALEAIAILKELAP